MAEPTLPERITDALVAINQQQNAIHETVSNADTEEIRAYMST